MNPDPRPDDDILDAEPVPDTEMPAVEARLQSPLREQGVIRPPRIWPIFVTYVVAFAVILIVQTIMVIAWIAWQVAQGEDLQQFIQQKMLAMLSTPAALMVLATPSQLIIGLAAVVPAALESRRSLRSCLGLVKPRLPGWGYPVVAVSAMVPTAVGLGFAYLVALALDSSVSEEQLYKQMTIGLAVPFVLFISLVPGFMEELFFRGYIQRRLLQRWPAGTAILVTSLLFAMLHVAPAQVAFAFPLGIWLGVVAWRTGSIWPGVVCHAFVNGAWNIWQIGARLGPFPEVPPPAALAAGAGVSLACFGITLWLLIRNGGGAIPGQEESLV